LGINRPCVDALWLVANGTVNFVNDATAIFVISYYFYLSFLVSYKSASADL